MRLNLTRSSSGTGRFPANLVSRPPAAEGQSCLRTHFSAFLRCVTMYPDRCHCGPESLGISAPFLPGNAGGSKVDPPTKLRSTCSEGARSVPLRAVNRPSSCCFLTPDSCLSRMTAAGPTVAAHRCLGVLALYGWFRASIRRMPAKSIRLGSWAVVTGPDGLQLIFRQ